MPIFGRKKEVGRGNIPTERIKTLILEGVAQETIINTLRKEGFSAEEIDKGLTQALGEVPEAGEEVRPEEVEAKKPAFAPLFVKLDRYRQILYLLNELRTTMAAIKNAFSVLAEVDRLREENSRMIRSAIDKVDKRLVALDSEFLRPSGFEEGFPAETYGVESLEGVVTDLKGQVDQLKSELESMD